MIKTPKSLRLHIGIFGKTNTGKSSLLNALIRQEVSITSSIAGTTTDVVEKSTEFFPIGPVTFLDTAGIDDDTALKEERLNKTLNTIRRCDVAVLVTDFNGFTNDDIELIEQFKKYKIPFLVIINKYDIEQIISEKYNQILEFTDIIIETSSLYDIKIIETFVGNLIKILPDDFVNPPTIIGDKVSDGDTVILVIPVDKEAPKGRLILPQVQIIRDLLDNHCVVISTQPEKLQQTLGNLKTKPKLIITDSQAFKTIEKIVPNDIYLTSFSIIFARYKGNLNSFIDGVQAIDNLKAGDKILFLESCTHRTIQDDIARDKIPKLLREKLGFDLKYDYKSGHDFPNINSYKLIIHCGGCMTNRKEILSRILIANEKNIPITNYGTVISYCLGILDRVTKIF